MRDLKLNNFCLTIFVIIFLTPIFLSSEYAFIDSSKFKNLLVLTAKNSKERQKGLMFFKKLRQTNGMILLYKKPQIVKIWMKNTLFSLDIIFVDKKKKVVAIKEGKKLEEKLISSDFPVVAVIEIPKDCSKKIGLKIGDTIDWNEVQKEEIEKDFLFNQNKFPCLN